MRRRRVIGVPIVSQPHDPARWAEFLHGPKDSSTIHYDEDTIPHGQCSDPVHCDCMCPHCWRAKVAIIEAALESTAAGRG